MKEHDTVVLTCTLPDHGLEIGDAGTIVHVYEDYGNGEAFEVEFADKVVVTLDPSDIRLV